MSTIISPWRRALRRRPAPGFAARLALATSLLIAAVCLGQSWLLARSGLQHLGSYLTERGLAISEYLAREARMSLAGGRLDALQQLAAQARAQSGVAYTRFFDRQGLLLVSTGSAPGTTLPVQAAAERAAAGPIPVAGDLWEFQAPIFADDHGPRRDKALRALMRVAPPQHLGTVAIGLSIEPLLALRRRTLATAAVLTSLFVLVAVVGAALLARAITQPLKALATAADAIAQGDFDAKVEPRTRDEIGGLARSFNAMAESVARSRAQLEEKVRELERANRLKSEFVATISHELRTPLNVIIGYAEMLAEGAAGAVNREQADILAAIRRYSALQRDLITSVLDFSRLAAGRVAYHVERFELEPLLTEIQARYAAQLEDAPVRLLVVVNAEVPALETDRSKVHEIVRNLVDNAVKFTEVGGISIRAQPAAAPGWVAIEVVDTGTGIPAVELPDIFDAFRQLGESSTRPTGGVGLGLSIVKQLALALGGTVSVKSQLREGSTFRVELPARLPAPAAATPGGALPDEAEEALDGVARNTRRVPANAPDLARPGERLRPERG